MIGVKNCPHCGTVYRYRDLLRMIKQRKKERKETVCYHCKKTFSASLFPRIIPVGIVWLILSIGTNILLLSGMKELNIPIMMIVTVIYIAAFVLSLPLCLKLRK